MKYNAKYDRWVTKGGLVYRYNKKKDRLIQCKLGYYSGYLRCRGGYGERVLVHRLVWETFVGEIPSGYQIDHKNTIRDDNRLENLRCVTPKENANNLLTKKHYSEAKKGNTFGRGGKGKITSEFGRKFKEHFGFSRYENPKLYVKECSWYHTHNKVCRWEAEDK